MVKGFTGVSGASTNNALPCTLHQIHFFIHSPHICSYSRLSTCPVAKSLMDGLLPFIVRRSYTEMNRRMQLHALSYSILQTAMSRASEFSDSLPSLRNGMLSNISVMEMTAFLSQGVVGVPQSWGSCPSEPESEVWTQKRELTLKPEPQVTSVS